MLSSLSPFRNRSENHRLKQASYLRLSSLQSSPRLFIFIVLLSHNSQRKETNCVFYIVILRIDYRIIEMSDVVGFSPFLFVAIIKSY